MSSTVARAETPESLEDADRRAVALADTLLDELSRIRGAALVAVFDARGVCRALRRSALICAFGSYRVLADVSDLLPGRSSITIDVDGRTVLARRLHDGEYAMIATGAAADLYETEVRLFEAVSGHALRATGAEPIASRLPLVSMTIPPPANGSPSELPPIEASLVLAVGSLADLYRDISDDADADGIAS
jgi:hypothetical protein